MIKRGSILHFGIWVLLLLCAVPLSGQIPCDVTLRMQSDTLDPEQQMYCLDIQVRDFRDILGVILPISFDSNYLDFDSVTSSTLQGVRIVEDLPGRVKLSWEDPAGIGFGTTLFNEEIILTVCFKLKTFPPHELHINMEDFSENREGSIFNKNIVPLRYCLDDAKLKNPCAFFPVEFPDITELDANICGDLANHSLFAFHNLVLPESAYPLTFFIYKGDSLLAEDIFTSPLDPPKEYFLEANTAYEMVVRNTYGCEKSSLINREDKPTEQFLTLYNSNVHNSCGDLNNGRITIEPGFPRDSLFITWSTGKQGWSCTEVSDACDLFTIDNLPPGIYDVVLERGQCKIVETFIVDNLPPYRLEIDVTAPNCGGSNGSIQVNIDPPGNYQFLWEDLNEQGSMIENLSSGRYSLRIVDSLGCENVETIIVDDVDIFYQIDKIDTAQCAMDGLVILTAYDNDGKDLEFEWSDGVTNLGFNQIRKEMKGGHQWVVIRNAYCQTDTILFEIPEKVSDSGLGIDTSNSEFFVCNGNEASVSFLLPAIPNNEWVLFNENRDTVFARILNLPAGEYQYFAQNAIGCTDSIAFQINEVSIDTTFLAEVPRALCSEESYILDVNAISTIPEGMPLDIFYGDSLYRQNEGIVLIPGSHTLEISAGDICLEFIDIQINAIETEDLDTINITSSPNIPVMLSIDSLVPNNVEVQWNISIDYVCSNENCSQISFMAESDVVFSWQGLTAEGCATTGYVSNQILRSHSNTISVTEIVSGKSEVNGRFCMYMGDNANSINYLRFFDRWGNKILETNGIVHEPLYCLDDGNRLADFPSGVYVYSMEIEFEDRGVEVLNRTVTVVK